MTFHSPGTTDFSYPATRRLSICQSNKTVDPSNRFIADNEITWSYFLEQISAYADLVKSVYLLTTTCNLPEDYNDYLDYFLPNLRLSSPFYVVPTK